MNEIKDEAEKASILRLRGFVNKDPRAFPEFILMCFNPLRAPSDITREASEDIGVLDKNGRINEVVCKFIKAVCRDGGESEESPKVKSDIRVPLHFDQQWR